MEINQPIQNHASFADIAAAMLTHDFYGDEGDDRCLRCDCRPWGRVAEYPCGTDVPREIITI